MASDAVPGFCCLQILSEHSAADPLVCDDGDEAEIDRILSINQSSASVKHQASTVPDVSSKVSFAECDNECPGADNGQTLREAVAGVELVKAARQCHRVDDRNPAAMDAAI